MSYRKETQKHSLDGVWEGRSADGSLRFQGMVPGSMYTDLLRSGMVENPYAGLNETIVRDISEKDFIYEKDFEADGALTEARQAMLCFEGIDTVAEIFLNDQPIGKTDNMHRSWEFDVTGLLRPGINTLRLHFHSPILYGKEEFEKAPAFELNHRVVMAGYSKMRKAHYQFGWDWGPQLPDMGLFRGVYIATANHAKIDDIWIRQAHENGLVHLTALSECTFFDDEDYSLEYNITAPGGELFSSSADARAGKAECQIPNPELWWPNNLGPQKLYGVAVRLKSGKRVLDERRFKIGLRTLTVSQEPAGDGEEFCFQVNGVKFFAMGANYIPEDNIIGYRTKERTEKLLQSCKDANFNCIRVWGGGFYPDDWFYDLCDEMGLVIWQDLMFACAVYDYHGAFRETVLLELEYNIKRARNHPSIGLWCGNNEMEEGWFYWSFGMSGVKKEEYIQYYRDCFERDCPELISRLDPDTFYWPSSPSSGGGGVEPRSDKRGDVHYWSLWHGKAEWDEYKSSKFRFLSEYGFESMPEMKTLRAIAKPEDLTMDSPVIRWHQKCSDGFEKLHFYMEAITGLPEAFIRTIYMTQLMQAYMIHILIEYMRQNRGLCMGSLYWQLNDSNPVISWSGIDYFGRWKALHYYVKRAYAPILLSVNYDDADHIRVNLSNETFEKRKGSLAWQLRQFDGRLLAKGKAPLAAEAFSAADTGINGIGDTIRANRSSCYLSCVLTFDDGGILEKTAVLDLYKNLALSPAKIDVKIAEETDRFAITLLSDTFAVGTALSLENADGIFSDNWIDLEAGIAKTVYLPKASISVSMNEDLLRQELNIMSYYPEK